jgi:hypothetical protein
METTLCLAQDPDADALLTASSLALLFGTVVRIMCAFAAPRMVNSALYVAMIA